ncbi:MAG: hypothetical protein K6G26_08095 [Lachnospiraceae bacterium]|nr:hypothetical protein [Lachnospiraceae bacterium]
MLTFFQVCFFAGLGLVLISFILGGLFDIGDMGDFSFDFGGHFDFGVHPDFGHFEIGHVDVGIPTSPLVYLSGIITFGGAGWLLMINDTGLKMWQIVLIAIACGIVIATPVNIAYKALRKAENTSSPDFDELINHEAVIKEKIIDGGFGAISYTFKGNSFEAPAKNVDEGELIVGTNVTITEIKDNVFYIKKS